MTTDTDDLERRLAERARTRNGQPVGAGDGDTYVPGHYGSEDAKLDTEALATIAKLREERDGARLSGQVILNQCKKLSTEWAQCVAESTALREELEKIAYFIEPHWQGAGAALTADWICAEIKERARQDDEALRAAEAESAALREALSEAVEVLEPFARLQLPHKPQYNAGAWSLRLDDIRAAKDWHAKHAPVQGGE